MFWQSDIEQEVVIAATVVTQNPHNFGHSKLTSKKLHWELEKEVWQNVGSLSHNKDSQAKNLILVFNISTIWSIVNMINWFYFDHSKQVNLKKKKNCFSNCNFNVNNSSLYLKYL